jgi:hypothetical protein
VHDERARLERSEALHARVQRFIRETSAGTPATDAFEALALELARHQAEAVPAIAHLYDARGVDAARVRCVDELPALPADAFRLRRIAAHAPALDTRTFVTSGTARGPEARGRHPMRTTATYAAGALAWAARMLWPDWARPHARVAALLAPETLAPESSLGFMVARFAEALCGVQRWHYDGVALDTTGLAATCADARAAGEPVLVAGTSFALAHASEGTRAAGGAFHLPARSRVMLTGGFKGRAREVEPAVLRTRVAEAFGVPPGHVVGEYGMTELSSQLYQASLAAASGTMAREGDADRADGGPYHPPPWLRVQAADPRDLAPLPAGREGLARMVDLANVDSAVVVQTADRVVVRDDGGVELLGRATGAPPRGCSLALEHLLAEHDP